MEANAIQAWVNAANAAIGMFRQIRDLMPAQSPERDRADEKIAAAERALRLADAELAKSLGYRLCQCKFPPEIMLWRESEKAVVCPNPECGRRIEQKEPPPPRQRRPWIDVDRG